MAGLILGPLLALLAVWLAPEISDQILLIAYAVVVLLVSASLTSTAKEGLLLAALTVVGETLVELLYFVSVYGVDVSIVPWAAGFSLFVGRIVLFPVAGVLGGYMGRGNAEKSTAKPREKSGRKVLQR
jgi:hypothetical protein